MSEVSLEDLSNSPSETISLIPAAPTAPSEEVEADYEVLMDKLTREIDQLTEREKSIACNEFAKKHSAHFLGFCTETDDPMFKRLG